MGVLEPVPGGYRGLTAMPLKEVNTSDFGLFTSAPYFSLLCTREDCDSNSRGAPGF